MSISQNEYHVIVEFLNSSVVSLSYKVHYILMNSSVKKINENHARKLTHLNIFH